eukprot:g31544.t1
MQYGWKLSRSGRTCGERNGVSQNDWGEHTPIYINRTEVDRVDSVEFLGVTMTDNLPWTFIVDTMVKKAKQHLFFLQQLRKF